jgi:release factor glutamine methyltransferase
MIKTNGGRWKVEASSYNNLAYLKHIESILQNMGVSSPRAEAEMLSCHYGKLERLELYTGQKSLSRSAKTAIGRVLKKRRSGVPLAYLTKEAFFWGHTFHVKPNVLIPRPETERLVEEVLKALDTHFKGKNPEVLDLGTGSGCIAVCLTLEMAHCRMTALDASHAALEIARKNIRRHGLSQKIRLVQSRLFESFEAKNDLWDVIVSNPPYLSTDVISGLSNEVRHEPALALDGGREGLDILEAILDQAPRYLRPGGFLLMEIGEGQSGILARRWRREYETFRFEKDLNGIERILIAKKSVPLENEV